MSRSEDLQRFYEILADVERRLGGKQNFETVSGKHYWPDRGVYFFFEPGEVRTDSGTGFRVVRVGTHALSSSSNSTLWGRLSQHRGVRGSGGGNHRGSIFRLVVGQAMMARDRLGRPTSWGVKADAGAAAKHLGLTRDEIKRLEQPIEVAVSRYIGSLPFLWISADDAPGPSSLRGVIERNSISLLSNYARPPLDPPSKSWLGGYSNRERVRRSGLWNNNHVEEGYRPDFLDGLANLVRGR